MDSKKNVTLMQMIVLNVINLGITGFISFDGAAMPLYLTQQFGLNNSQIGMLLGIGKVMIALSMFFGLYSDLTWFKWGKRRPIMLIGGLLSAPLIALVPHVGALWMLIIMMVVYYFGVQFAAIPYYALVPEVVPNEKLGTANAFFSIFGGLGTAIAYAVLLGVVYKADKPLAFLILGVMHLVCTLTTVFLTKEYTPETKPEKVNRVKALLMSPVEIFKDMPKYPSLAVFLLSNLFFWISLGAFVVFFTKFMEYYVNIPGTKAAFVLAAVVVVSIVFAVPVGVIGDKLNRKMLCAVGMFMIFGGLLTGYFLIGPGSVVSAKDLTKISDVTRLAEQYGIDQNGATLDVFPNTAFDGKGIDVNDDGMKDKKADVMRWCLNGALDAKQCATAVAKVIPTSDPAYKPTVKFFDLMAKDIQKYTNKVLVISFVVISFTAIGLTVCFLIMAAILPTIMPEEKMGLYIGFNTTVTGIGNLISLVLAGFVMDLTMKLPALGYRWMFVQGALFMLLAAITILRAPYIPNAKDPTISDIEKGKAAQPAKK